MAQTKEYILNCIKETLQRVAPEAKAILFGSQARGTARSDSDWDILILVDKSRIEASDYDRISYPLVELGWNLNQCISPIMYTLTDWMKYSFSPFYHIIKKEGIELI
ncbi:nucleotidyltransferase domain-containing protein [Parabacteroides pacaensis]|uniref:nucleotidyltransferase domain-containing protein n=1 Tax=Parabacteroides pacaensis TaxID=2086575 RepID=UPI000D0FF8EA|nr:nucleotidyltransferase domain-containing protein [Parabacteroides pacaensis]